MRTRLRVGLVLSGVLLVGLASGWSVAAQAADETPTTTADPLAGMVGIGDQLYFSGAVITPSDGSAVRSLSARQAAVFVQSWIGTAFFGGSNIAVAPPPDLPVTRVDISGQWGPGNLGVNTVYYATGAGQVYVAWPQNQPLAAAPGGPPPPPENWFVAPARVTDALEGKADLLETAGTQTADDYLTATTEAGPQSANTASGEGADGAVRVAAAVAASGVLIALVWRRRRSQ